jgi:alpha-L-rhamnosidase
MVGLDTEEDGPGYRHIRVKPHIGEGFTHASASLKTYYGTVSGGWKKDNDQLQLDVEIPANTSATIYFPAGNAEAITESGKALSAIPGIKINGVEKGYVVIETGSGKYKFAVRK